MKFCPKCGQPLNPGDRVCPQCGNPLPAENATYSQPPMQQPSMQQPMMQEPMQQPQKSNKTNIVLISIIGVLVVVIAVGVTWFLASGGKEETTTEEVTVIPNIDTVKPVDTIAAMPAPAEQQKPAAPSSPYDYVVNGSIGPYKIEMQISFNGNAITGRYRYKRKNGKGGWLKLTGNYDGNNFSMYEEDSKGNVTGTFEGYAAVGGGQASMSGTMWNSKGDSYSFNVSGTASN